MPYEVYLKFKDREMSFEAFLELFSKRKNCRVDDQLVVYENSDTGVGFYYEYMHGEDKSAPNVRSDGVYRVALCVEYCQPMFFFVEALYEIYDLVRNDDIVVYDPQIGGMSGGGKFDDVQTFESWKECNFEAVREYMLSLGEEMDDVPVMPYDTLKQMWEWNYSISRLREELGNKIQIPTMQVIDLGDKYLTAVVWKDGGSIAIPYVDILVFAMGKDGGDEGGFYAIDYEEAKPLIEKYFTKIYANAYVLDYDDTPEEISKYIAGLDSGLEFMPMNMCDILEYEVAERALFSDPR